MTTAAAAPEYSADRPAAPSLPRSPAARHSTELDVLRAVAIASVLSHHYRPETAWTNRVQHGSVLGVLLFFTLSGFLITRILAGCRAAAIAGRTGTGRSLGTFYARRFLRIFPLYYAVLAVAVATHAHGARTGFGWHVSYLSNVYYARKPFALNQDPTGVFWTLSVEEQFYLVWPFAVLLLPVRWVPRLTLVLAAAGAAFAGWAQTRGVGPHLLTPAHLVYLALGGYVGLAEAAPFGSEDRQARVMRLYLVAAAAFAVAATATNVLPARYDAVHFAFRYTATALAFGWVVARLGRGVGGPVGRVLRWSPLAYVGRISYGVYILEFFVTGPMDRGVPTLARHLGPAAATWMLQSFAARTLAIVAVASVSWFAYERPLNELKRHFPYVRRRTL